MGDAFSLVTLQYQARRQFVKKKSAQSFPGRQEGKEGGCPAKQISREKTEEKFQEKKSTLRKLKKEKNLEKNRS